MGSRGAFVDVSSGDFSFKEGGQPHRHVYMSHNKNDPGIPPTSDEKELIRKIKKEFHLK